MVDIATALVALKAITEFAKDAKSSALNARVLELQDVMLDLVGQLATERECRERVEKRLREFEALQDLGAGLELRDAMYWKAGKPYCQHCFASKGHLLALKTISEGGYFECPGCKNQFTTEQYRTQSREDARRFNERVAERNRNYSGWLDQ